MFKLRASATFVILAFLLIILNIQDTSAQTCADDIYVNDDDTVCESLSEKIKEYAYGSAFPGLIRAILPDSGQNDKTMWLGLDTTRVESTTWGGFEKRGQARMSLD